MSMQIGLGKQDEEVIKNILNKHNVDWLEDEVPINVSSLNDYDKEETFVEERMYIQVD